MGESALTFPCEFPLKIVGRCEQGFAQRIATVVQRHAPEFDATSIGMRPSREGKYLSLTCTIQARSREQLDALYGELSREPSVVFLL